MRQRSLKELAELVAGRQPTGHQTAPALAHAQLPPVVLCRGCLHFAQQPGEQPDGHCRKYGESTWSEVEFSCPGFEPADEAERARAARQARVEADLRAHPDKRLAFEVAEAPLKGSPGEPVSVVAAIRHGENILSGELHIPRERWDLKTFMATVDPTPASGVS